MVKLPCVSLQYVFDITAEMDKIMVSLEQHDISHSRQELGIHLNDIGFQIMKVLQKRLKLWDAFSHVPVLCNNLVFFFHLYVKTSWRAPERLKVY